MKHLQDLPVLVLGLGASGLAMARWCARHGARVTVADTRDAPPQLAALRSDVPDAAFVAGAFTDALVQGGVVRAVYLSPGLAPSQTAVVTDAARAIGLPVGGELDLFARALADLQGSEPAPAGRSDTDLTTVHPGTDLTTVRSDTDFTTVRPEPVEGLHAAGQGFDKLSPNGVEETTDLSTVCPGTDLSTVRSETDLSTVRPEPVEGLHAADQGFDKLSPNGLAELQNGLAELQNAMAERPPALAEPSPALTEPSPEPQYRPAVLAITGTNGKTTVTALTGQLVERAGRSVAVAGNIGPSLLDTLGGHLDAGTLPQVWVLELSSFQLDGATGFEPTAATVLNISQDHLDWHGGMQPYVAAKARIFGERGLMVLNREDPAVMGMLPPVVKVRLQKPRQRPHVTFGGDMPRRPGDFGIEVVNGMAWLVRAQEADETRRRRGDEAEELHIQRLMPADALRIRGRHNAVNALSALALAQAAGCALAPMLYGLREYHGEPHRVESVAIIDGVEFFDDSKGTNVGATVAALTGLGADRRIVVILGGVGKDQDFAPLASPVARHARAVVLIGRDGPQIGAALAGAGVALHTAATLPEAVASAARLAHSGDAVLLSPACASFDMFRGYDHRAEVFREAVAELADLPAVRSEPVAAAHSEPVAAAHSEPAAAAHSEPVAAVRPEPGAAARPELFPAVRPEPVEGLPAQEAAATSPARTPVTEGHQA